MNTDSLDMAVIGAGPAGSVCAYSALAESAKAQVALVDLETFPRDKPCGDAVRCDAAAILKNLGLGAIFDGRPVVGQLEYTIPAGFDFKNLKFSLTDGGVDPVEEVGYYVIERKVFDHHLYEAAVTAGAQDYTGHKLLDARFDESEKIWNLTLQEQSGACVEIRSRVLVGADGAGSRVRRLAGLDLNGQADRAVALRAYAQTKDIKKDTLRIDWLEGLIPGYGWVFPMAEDKVNIGVVLDVRDYKRQGGSLVSHLEDYVQFLGRNGVAIRDLGPIQSHSLPLASASPPLVPKQCVALVGDAAAMINPMTGEGIHYAIWAAHSLGGAVGQGVNQETSVQAALEHYEKAYAGRYGDAMDSYQKLRTWMRFLNFLTGPLGKVSDRRHATPASGHA